MKTTALSVLVSYLLLAIVVTETFPFVDATLNPCEPACDTQIMPHLQFFLEKVTYKAGDIIKIDGMIPARSDTNQVEIKVTDSNNRIYFDSYTVPNNYGDFSFNFSEKSLGLDGKYSVVIAYDGINSDVAYFTLINGTNSLSSVATPEFGPATILIFIIAIIFTIMVSTKTRANIYS